MLFSLCGCPHNYSSIVRHFSPLIEGQNKKDSNWINKSLFDWNSSIKRAIRLKFSKGFSPLHSRIKLFWAKKFEKN